LMSMANDESVTSGTSGAPQFGQISGIEKGGMSVPHRGSPVPHLILRTMPCLLPCVLADGTLHRDDAIAGGQLHFIGHTLTPAERATAFDLDLGFCWTFHAASSRSRHWRRAACHATPRLARSGSGKRSGDCSTRATRMSDKNGQKNGQCGLHQNYRPPPPAKPRPAEPLWEFRAHHHSYACELRYHGEYGVEAQIRREGGRQMMEILIAVLGERFQPRRAPRSAWSRSRFRM
jgi:hypothetical protein